DPVTDQHERATDTRGRPLPPADELRGTARRHEDTSSTFRVAPGLSADETSRRLSVALAIALRDLADRPALGHPTVTYDRLMRWHRAVFGGLFKRDAGRIRRAYEDVVFSNVYVDRRGTEFWKVFHGSPADEIKADLDAACATFAAVQQRHAGGRASPAEL